MPDHLHAIIAFSGAKEHGLRNVLQNWKRYSSRTFGIDWQRDFFDHRIRNEKDHAEKWAYLQNNPVRKGLVDDYTAWPHVWFPDRQGW